MNAQRGKGLGLLAGDFANAGIAGQGQPRRLFRQVDIGAVQLRADQDDVRAVGQEGELAVGQLQRVAQALMDLDLLGIDDLVAVAPQAVKALMVERIDQQVALPVRIER